MKKLSPYFRSILCVSLLFSVSACSTLKSSDDPLRQTSSDPFQGFNRGVYSFNSAADRAILKPVAKGYKAITPDPIENGVGNFFSNLGEPLNILNNLLQGKVDGALNSTYRFAVNSTVGVLGLFDVAKAYEVDHKPEDFGQTLASWGAAPGPYIVIPFLGPTNLRDGLGRIVDTSILYPNRDISESTQTQIGLFLLDTVDTRARLIGVDDTLNNQLDPYLFLKNAYDSNRRIAVYDGSPPEQSDEDLDF